MRVAEILGTVTLSRCIPEFVGARLRLVRQLSLSDLQGRTTPGAEEVVAWDEQGSGIGDRVALSDGAEAAQPFRPAMKPVDAYVAAILDTLELGGN